MANNRFLFGSFLFSQAKRCLLIVAAILTAASMSPAASRFWDGSSDGNFANAANWVGGVAPLAGDDLVFQGPPVTRLVVTNNFSPNRAFNSVLFQGSNYFVRGNPIIVSNGINSINPVGQNDIDADVNVRASQTWEAQGALASIDVNGDIALNANTLTVRANTGDFFFSGIVSGTGNIVKTNVGTLRLDGGTGHNTYSGFTRLDGGVLELNKFAIIPTPTNFTAIPGDLTIGDGNGLVATDFLRLLTGNQIADTSDVTVRDSGVFDLNDSSDRIGALTMQGGTVDSGDLGILILGGNVSTLAETTTAFINGNLSLGGASRTFDVVSASPAIDLRINADISAGTVSPALSAGFTKTGGGTLYLAGTNTYNGTTTINDGQVVVAADRALGATTTLLGFPAATVVNGDANLFLSGVQVTNENLTINSTNGGGAFNASGASIWTGDILLNTNAFISSTGTLLLSGEISGVGGFTKLSAGTITLGGSNANTYSGTTTVRDGTLLLDKDTTAADDPAMSGRLVIGEDELPENSDVVRFLACCQLPTDTDITINASGLLDLNGFGQNVSDIIFNGGDIATGAGSILPIGNITVNRNTNSQAVISGRMSVLSNPIINVTGHNFSPDLSITAQLFGAGGLTKNGVGEVSLESANTYSGVTIVNDGFLLVDDSAALGSTANGTVVNSGAVLALRFGVAIPAEDLTLAGNGQSIFGALSSSFGSNSWAGDITLSSNATVYVDTGDVLNISGSITTAVSADLTKTGTGVLIFSGATANSFDDMFVNGGTLVLNKSIPNGAGPADLSIGDLSGTDIVRLGNDNQIADTTEVHVNSTGRFDLNDQQETTGAIDGRGVIDLGAGTLRAGADNDSSTFAGFIIGTGNLFKLGTGTWTLTGDNTYSGQTTVSAGTLVVNGEQEQSPVVVNGTATLMGTGVIGDLRLFGNLRPGLSPGSLTVSNIDFESGGDFFVELNGANPGTGYDQLNVRGTNQLGSSTLHVSVGFAPVEGQQFVIINNDGSEAIQGTFSGLPNGSIVTANNLQFHIRYSAIFENDVVLTLTNTAADFVAASVSGGNGDGAIDVNECNFLNVVITNTSGLLLSGVTATLVPTTPGISVTMGNSSYPNIPAAGRGTNSTPFQFSTGPGFICGTHVEFHLVVETPANGTFTIPISLPSGAAGPPRRFNNNTVTAIPDNGSVDVNINVAGITTPIKRVTVSLHITHTTDSDLDISLIGPDGTTIVLSSDNGGSASDYGTDCAADARRTTFADLASTSIVAGSAPFEGSFRPEQSFAAFNEKFGSDVNGGWRLRIADDTPGGVGSLRCWSLFLSPTACNDSGGGCESCPEDRAVVGLLGVGSQIQTNRLIRNTGTSLCGSLKACPGAEGPLADRFLDAYTFENGESNACITVTLEAPCNLFSAAYTNRYDPANLCSNYLADMNLSLGADGGTLGYSFDVGPGARFVVVVHGIAPADACEYRLTVDGGSCRPRLVISPSGSQVVLDWTSAAVGYALERTNSLPNSALPAWLPVPGTPTISGGRFRVTENATPPPPANFYRLRKP
jgi:autotransporter-associated beta strand protein